MGERREPSKKQRSFESGGALSRKVFNLVCEGLGKGKGKGKDKGKGKGKVHPCSGTEALYRPYGP